MLFSTQAVDKPALLLPTQPTADRYEAAHLADIALKLAEQAGSPQQIRRAAAWLAQALTVVQHNSLLHAEILLNLSLLGLLRGDWVRAEQLARAYLARFRRWPDAGRRLAHLAYETLGQSARWRQRHDLALHWLRQAAATPRERHDVLAELSLAHSLVLATRCTEAYTVLCRLGAAPPRWAPVWHSVWAQWYDAMGVPHEATHHARRAMAGLGSHTDKGLRRQGVWFECCRLLAQCLAGRQAVSEADELLARMGSQAKVFTGLPMEVAVQEVRQLLRRHRGGLLDDVL